MTLPPEPSELDPLPRLLMGPGPVNADPRVLRAMACRLLGQFDPELTGYMNEAMALYPPSFRDAQPLDLPDRRHRARRHRGGAGLADRARRPRAGGDLRPLRPAAARDRRALRRRRRSGSRRRGARCSTPDAIEDAIKRTARSCVAMRARRHLDHDGAAARGDRRHLPPRTMPALCRCHRDARRHGYPGRRLADRCRDRRPAEVPGGPARLARRSPSTTAPKRDPSPQACRGRHPARRLCDAATARASARTISISRC